MADALATTEAREGRRELRQQQIVELAIGLFADCGYHGVGVDLIGQKAGMSGPAIYSYFSGKGEILTCIFDTAVQKLCQGAEQAMSNGDSLDRMKQLVRFHLSFVLADLRLSSVYVTERRNLPANTWPAIRAMQRTYIDHWMRAIGDIRPDLSAAHSRMLAESMIGMVNSLAFYRTSLPKASRRAFLQEIIMTAVTSANGTSNEAIK